MAYESVSEPERPFDLVALGRRLTAIAEFKLPNCGPDSLR
jgi:hypothetical protein